MNRRKASALLAAVAAAFAVTLAPRAQAPVTLNEKMLSVFPYRNLGPFRMGARTSDIAVPASPQKDHLYTFYVSFWTGGVWKTVNNGTTFEPVFDDQTKLAIGDVTVAPSNSNIVWVGTGDAFTSRSSYAGDGVYKSTDAAKTWKNMGLKDSHHISRIQIDPANPDVVYVAAMGHLYSDNSERGVFKTTNGGQTWEKVLFISDRVGIIDLVMNPKNPNVLYAAAYEKERLPWQMIDGGAGSGIYKTTDGGKTWNRLANGLPDGRIGRIGLDIFLGNPEILYAVVQNNNTRPAGSIAAAPPTNTAMENIYGGQIYRTDNAGATWTRTSAEDFNVSPKGPYYFSQIRVNPGNEQDIYVTQDNYRHSNDGGRTWNAPRVFNRMFGDYRTLWIDPENPERMLAGSDGGIAMSYDGGRTSDAYSNIPVGEVYNVGFDMEDPYNIYVGLQDHEHWRGPSNTGLGRVTVWDWLALGDGDGIFTQVDPTDSRWLYTTREYGGHTRVDQKAGFETNITPTRTSGDPYRWLWSTPVALSPHDSKTIYIGAQVLLKSIDRGDHWTEVSPDLSTNDKTRILRETESGVPGGIPWFGITTISESPVTKGVIWVGTSDGNVQVTRNDGGTWTNATAKIAAVGGRADRYVSRVRASAHVAGRAYVSKSGYKFDDFTPYLYRTDDFGATWTSIVSNLPNEPINVVYEDAKNPELLFVGNDTGVFVSIDRGARWVKMNNNMPNIPVHDLLVHPREQDLILGSYGRDLWVTNIGPLQEMNNAMLAEDVHLFATKPAVQRVLWSFGANDYLFGQRHLSTPNEPAGMIIRYYVKAAVPGGASVAITNAQGQEVARLNGPTAAGINSVTWSMRAGGGGGGRGTGGGGAARGAGAGTRAGGAGAARAGGAGTTGTGAAPPAAPPQAGAGRGGGTVIDQLAPVGDYTVTLTVAGKTLTQKARIAATQGWPLTPGATIIR